MPKINYVEMEEKIKAIDIPSMSELSDEEYQSIVEEDLIHLDHHEILRDSVTGHPLATSQRQVDILIDVLNGLKVRMRQVAYLTNTSIRSQVRWVGYSLAVIVSRKL